MENHPLRLNRSTDARPKSGKTRNADARVIGRGWWLRSKAGGRLKGKDHYIDLRMAQVSGNGRRRRAQENMGHYPKMEAVGPGRGCMGPFCVCRGTNSTGSLQVGKEDRRASTDGGERARENR